MNYPGDILRRNTTELVMVWNVLLTWDTTKGQLSAGDSHCVHESTGTVMPRHVGSRATTLSEWMRFISPYSTCVVMMHYIKVTDYIKLQVLVVSLERSKSSLRWVWVCFFSTLNHFHMSKSQLIVYNENVKSKCLFWNTFLFANVTN